MPDLQMDVAVANRFISSLSKSLQALCHGCMDFDSGIEIVGYININIDSGSKVDYVLNEKVLKSTTNSMTFVSNSFLAKKDVPKQTRDGACSPIPELRPLPQTPYYRGAYQGPRSSMHFAQSYSQRGSQKRAWPGMERDWRISPKKHRGGRVGHPSYQATSSPQNTAHVQSSIPGAQTGDADFKMPLPSEGTSLSEAVQSAINVKKEVMDSENTQQSSELDQTCTEQPGEESLQASEINIKKDPDAESIQNPSETQTDQGSESLSANTTDADFKGTFLHPGNDSNNTENNIEAGTDEETVDPNERITEQGNQDSSLLSGQGDGSDIPGEFGATNDNFSENMPSCSADFGEAGGDESYTQPAYSDAGEGSSDAGQFEVIEIEDEDEDVQGLFGDSRENGKTIKKRRSRRALKAAKKRQKKRSRHATSESADDPSGTYKKRSSVEICSFCRVALPMGTTFQQHFDEVHMSEASDTSMVNPFPGYSCEICQKTFVTKERLRQHSTVHDTVLYSCFVCDVKFKHKKNIKRHIETTHGLKKCSYCMALFTKGEQFDNHLLSCINYEKGEIQGDIENLYTY